MKTMTSITRLSANLSNLYQTTELTVNWLGKYLELLPRLSKYNDVEDDDMIQGIYLSAMLSRSCAMLIASPNKNDRKGDATMR